MTSVFVTGSNRGLGLEWVKQYAKAGWRVYATCRHPTEAFDLHDLATTQKNVSIHRLDVTKPDEINAVAVELMNESVDVLLNNAGVYPEKYWEVSVEKIRYEDWEYTFRVNTMGAVRLAAALQDHISRSRKRLIVVISTHMGSITDIEEPGSYYYRSSKAALNAVMKGLSYEMKPLGVGVLILHPGWVKTRMGGPGTALLPPESVQGMRSIVEDFTMAQTGRFYRHDGIEMPW
ncbi:MAG: SDR family oxidoreductase [Thermodesulfobacteriota bacterium]|nr:SDR family oxidoreductase [Thermodesulfobacteriota bacterium]